MSKIKRSPSKGAKSAADAHGKAGPSFNPKKKGKHGNNEQYPNRVN
ncbi:MAG: hypothetical protein K0S51_2402 [Bacillales bacterium]|jgi:hypothetical protein|nr:hypothetical protein [Bacillales bacterium]MDF2947723.1 hypothetical protein [Bacillales bacterium]